MTEPSKEADGAALLLMQEGNQLGKLNHRMIALAFDAFATNVVKALREPSEEMWQAWRSVNCKTEGEFTDFSGDYGNWLACHHAMIDAAIDNLSKK